MSFCISIVYVSYLIIKIKHLGECPEGIPGFCSPCLSFFSSSRFNWIYICSCSRATLWVPLSLIKKVRPLQKQLLKQLQRQLLSRYRPKVQILFFKLTLFFFLYFCIFRFMWIYIQTWLQCHERDWIFCVVTNECCSDQGV